jgi:hypothetical protein
LNNRCIELFNDILLLFSPDTTVYCGTTEELARNYSKDRAFWDKKFAEYDDLKTKEIHKRVRDLIDHDPQAWRSEKNILIHFPDDEEE